MKYPPYRGDEPCTQVGPTLYEQQNQTWRELEIMRDLCGSCWILDDCRDWALRHEPSSSSFWGGLTASERVRIRREQRISVSDPVTWIEFEVRRASA